MTLPDERLNSLNRTRDFLYSLLGYVRRPKTPKEWKEIREKVYWCLRHYPYESHLELISKCPHCSKIIGVRK